LRITVLDITPVEKKDKKLAYNRFTRILCAGTKWCLQETLRPKWSIKMLKFPIGYSGNTPK